MGPMETRKGLVQGREIIIEAGGTVLEETCDTNLFFSP